MSASVGSAKAVGSCERFAGFYGASVHYYAVYRSFSCGISEAHWWGLIFCRGWFATFPNVLETAHMNNISNFRSVG